MKEELGIEVIEVHDKDRRVRIVLLAVVRLYKAVVLQIIRACVPCCYCPPQNSPVSDICHRKRQKQGPAVFDVVEDLLGFSGNILLVVAQS